MRASDTSEVLFEDCRVPIDRLLGEEGRGFVDTMQVLDAGRIGIAALGRPRAGRLRGGASLRAGAQAFGKTISAFQAIQWKLADNATRIEAARLMIHRAAYLKDRGDRIDAGIVDGEALRQRDCGQGGRRLRRSTGVTASWLTIRRRNSSATSSSRRSAKAPARFSASSLPGSCSHDDLDAGRPRPRATPARSRAAFP